MENIIKYIKDIAVYVILTGFISIIIPNNSYKKYIKLVIGVILVAIVIEPIKRGLK